MTGADGDQVAAAAPTEEVPAQAADVPKDAEAAAAEPEVADGDAEMEQEEGDAAADDKADDASHKQPREPVKLGYKTFKNGDEACAYFRNLMSVVPTYYNMNEYEHKALKDLLEKGHPNAEKKIGCGLAGFQVRKFNEGGALAFYAIRTDGSAEDFSYLKCLATLFPGVSSSGSGRGRDRGRDGPKSEGGRGSGRGGVGRGGRGRGGRGRGGRGRGRGRS